MTDRDQAVQNRGDVDDWFDARISRLLLRVGAAVAIALVGAGAWFARLEAVNTGQRRSLDALAKGDTVQDARTQRLEREQDSMRLELRHLPSQVADTVIARLRRGR